jgi:hypothetical protein
MHHEKRYDPRQIPERTIAFSMFENASFGARLAIVPHTARSDDGGKTWTKYLLEPAAMVQAGGF